MRLLTLIRSSVPVVIGVLSVVAFVATLGLILLLCAPDAQPAPILDAPRIRRNGAHAQHVGKRLGIEQRCTNCATAKAVAPPAPPPPVVAIPVKPPAKKPVRRVAVSFDASDDEFDMEEVRPVRHVRSHRARRIARSEVAWRPPAPPPQRSYQAAPVVDPNELPYRPASPTWHESTPYKLGPAARAYEAPRYWSAHGRVHAGTPERPIVVPVFAAPPRPPPPRFTSAPPRSWDEHRFDPVPYRSRRPPARQWQPSPRYVPGPDHRGPRWGQPVLRPRFIPLFRPPRTPRPQYLRARYGGIR